MQTQDTGLSIPPPVASKKKSFIHPHPPSTPSSEPPMMQGSLGATSQTTQAQQSWQSSPTRHRKISFSPLPVEAEGILSPLLVGGGAGGASLDIPTNNTPAARTPRVESRGQKHRVSSREVGGQPRIPHSHSVTGQRADGDGITRDAFSFHVLHQLQRPLPLSAFLRGTDGCVVCDGIAGIPLA